MRFQATIPALAALALLAAACSEGSTPEATTTSGNQAPTASPTEPVPEPDPSDLVAEGRSVYLGNCIACHNPDPKVDGALGPAIDGASQPLLEARVLRGEYPEGYTPKRDSKNMIPMPFLERKIPALAAYLASEAR